MGSSSRMTWGSVASSIAISSFRLSPWDEHARQRLGVVAEPDLVEPGTGGARWQSSVARGNAQQTEIGDPSRTWAASRTFSQRGQRREQAGGLECATEAGPCPLRGSA